MSFEDFIEGFSYFLLFLTMAIFIVGGLFLLMFAITMILWESFMAIYTHWGSG